MKIRKTLGFCALMRILLRDALAERSARESWEAFFRRPEPEPELIRPAADPVRRTPEDAAKAVWESYRAEYQRLKAAIDAQAEELTELRETQEAQEERIDRLDAKSMQLDHRLAMAESEIAFNREQRERIFSLLEIEELERDACVRGSSAWQKHQAKVISLEAKVHTVQRKIDKAMAEKRLCEIKLA